MKIAVVGAGAIGSVIGGLLSGAGEDVTLISRKPHVDAMNQNGLVLDGESGKTVIRVKTGFSLIDCKDPGCRVFSQGSTVISI